MKSLNRIAFGNACLLAAILLVPGAGAQEFPHGNGPNAEAVKEVLARTLTTANASWWGFDEEDATEFLQAAIDSNAETVVVPYMGAPWVVKPIRLRGNLTMRFEPGVVVLAKEGEFKGERRFPFQGL